MHTDRPQRQSWRSKIWAGIGIALFVAIDFAHADQNSALPTTDVSAANANSAPACLSDGTGFLRARLWGSIRADLAWNDASLECTGATRPKGGARLRFSHPFHDARDSKSNGQAAKEQQLVFVFGVPGLREGVDAKALPVNITVIRQGAGRFFGTLGDDKCLIDELHQRPIAGIPLRNRSYRVEVRGFCTQPAREIQGDGLLHITRFDFAGRVDYDEEDSTTDDATLAQRSNK